MRTIFKTIAAAKGWGFSYGSRDMINLLENATPGQIQLLVDVRKRESERSPDTGLSTGNYIYTGKFLLVVKSDLDEVYDDQLEVDSSDGKYEKAIQPITTHLTGALALLEDSLICDHDLIVGVWIDLEVTNQLDENMDGVSVTYKLTEVR